MKTTISVNSKINTATPFSVPADVDISEVIDALKGSLGVRETHETYYTVERPDDSSAASLVKHTDISYHGSPMYEDDIITTDENIINMFEAIESFEKAYKNWKKAEA